MPDITAPDEIAAIPTPPARPRLSFQEIFAGRDGLRAGWSLLLYSALLFSLMLGSGFRFQSLQRPPATSTQSAAPQPSTPSSSSAVVLVPPNELLTSEGLSFFCVVAATWIMAKIERRPNAAFGFGGQRRLRNFLAGLGWGAALLSLLVFSLRACGLLAFDARLLFGKAALRYGMIWFGGFLLVGLFEECFFRGYLQFTLARGLSGICGWLHVPHREAVGFWAAAVLLSFGFGFTHRSNAGESPIGLLAVGLIGIVFCLSLWRTGSLWWAIGFHAAWDWAQSFLYGVADSGNMVQGHLFGTHPVGRPVLSGGLTGPEGSILILPIVALTAAVIVLTLPDTRSGDALPEIRPETILTTQQPSLHLDLP